MTTRGSSSILSNSGWAVSVVVTCSVSQHLIYELLQFNSSTILLASRHESAALKEILLASENMPQKIAHVPCVLTPSCRKSIPVTHSSVPSLDNLASKKFLLHRHSHLSLKSLNMFFQIHSYLSVSFFFSPPSVINEFYSLSI